MDTVIVNINRNGRFELGGGDKSLVGKFAKGYYNYYDLDDLYEADGTIVGSIVSWLRWNYPDGAILVDDANMISDHGGAPWCWDKHKSFLGVLKYIYDLLDVYYRVSNKKDFPWGLDYECRPTDDTRTLYDVVYTLKFNGKAGKADYVYKTKVSYWVARV